MRAIAQRPIYTGRRFVLHAIKKALNMTAHYSQQETCIITESDYGQAVVNKYVKFTQDKGFEVCYGKHREYPRLIFPICMMLQEMWQNGFNVAFTYVSSCKGIKHKY